MVMCIALCHAHIIYVSLTSHKISRVFLQLHLDNHIISIGTCGESLNIVYECVAKKVMKSPIAKNFDIVKTTNKQLLGTIFSNHQIVVNLFKFKAGFFSFPAMGWVQWIVLWC